MSAVLLILSLQFYLKKLQHLPNVIKTIKNNNDFPQVILGVRECRQDEEGDYKCVLRSKEHGEIDFDFKLFVTVEGGMDFR